MGVKRHELRPTLQLGGVATGWDQDDVVMSQHGGRTPVSLEDIRAMRQAEMDKQARPKFLTTREREERKRKQVEGKDASTVATKASHEERVDAKQRRRNDAKHASAPFDYPPPPPMQREQELKGKKDKEGKPWNATKEGNETDVALLALRQRVLGNCAPSSRKVTKGSEKSRLKFEWEDDEDTTKDAPELYRTPADAGLLFGRGLRAGIDRREQRKKARLDGKEDGTHRRTYDGFDMKVDAHWSEKPLSKMTERDWRIFREDFQIAVKGGAGVPRPLRKWDEAETCGLPPKILQAVRKVGYAHPSPIQMAAIPIGLGGRDIIGIAETGSGKTCAFVLPMLAYISRQPKMTPEIEAEGPYALVMAPTRELALQIEEETKKFAHFLGYRVTAVVGGQSIEEQGFKLRKGCEIVIATPGRMVDCLDRSYAVLNQCNFVVLDEADRMIDMGFEPQVNAVLDVMPSTNLKPENEDEPLEKNKTYRTTLMFSATMPPAVERIARTYLRHPVTITIGSAGRVADNVTQVVKMCKENDKPRLLFESLELAEGGQAIVFANIKRTCDVVAKMLEGEGYAPTILHGGKTQDQREASLDGFRSKKFDVLVATDVAGRGIDISDVGLVINYDMPPSIEQYTHRIGRTGRAGKKGTAVTLVTGYNKDVYYDLKQMLVDSNAHVPPELSRHEASRSKPGVSSGMREIVH